MKDIRRAILIDLLAGPRFMGDRVAFCQAAGITNGRLSQLLDPKEVFGDVAAKNLCEKLELPEDYFTSAKAVIVPSKSPPAKANSGASLAQWFEQLPQDDNLRNLVYVLCLDVIGKHLPGIATAPIHTHSEHDNHETPDAKHLV